MGATANTAAIGGQAGPATVCRTETTECRAVSAVTARARLLWGAKVAVELAIRANVSVRTAEAWLAGDRGIGGEPLARLLQSDQGVAFLDALIQAMPPSAQDRWRKQFEKAAVRADLRRQEAEIEARRRAHDL